MLCNSSTPYLAKAVVEWLVNHRLKRESKVIDRLTGIGRSNRDVLVKSVYDDVDESLHEMAKLSLLAHLIKLQQENRAVHHPDGSWEMLQI